MVLTSRRGRFVAEEDALATAVDERESKAARSALRKASLRLLPLIGLGYGIAYMDRVNISFAALQMNTIWGSARRRMGWARDFSSELCDAGGAVEPAAGAIRSAAVAGADHADVGIDLDGHGIGADAVAVLCAAIVTGRGGGRIFPGSHFLSHALVPAIVSRARSAAFILRCRCRRWSWA